MKNPKCEIYFEKIKVIIIEQLPTINQIKEKYLERLIFFKKYKKTSTQ